MGKLKELTNTKELAEAEAAASEAAKEQKKRERELKKTDLRRNINNQRTLQSDEDQPTLNLKRKSASAHDDLEQSVPHMPVLHDPYSPRCPFHRPPNKKIDKANTGGLRVDWAQAHAQKKLEKRPSANQTRQPAKQVILEIEDDDDLEQLEGVGNAAPTHYYGGGVVAKKTPVHV